MSGYRPGPLAILCAAIVAAFLLMPLLAVVPVSFTPARFLSMPNGHLSLRHYQELFDNPAWGQGVLLSLKIGIVASLVATALAVMFGLGIWMLRPRFAAVLVGYDTWLGVALAHVVMIAPFAVVLILVALSQVDRRIDLAARGLGASVAQRAFRVILPNIRFGIVTALLLSFVLSWEEIGVTLFVSSVNAITLPRLMWMGLRDNIDPAIAAISVLLITLTVTVLLARIAVRRLLARRLAQ
jgi:putative spermidine/putrescine transport system permease protein